MVKQFAVMTVLLAVACSSHPAPSGPLQDQDRVAIGYGTQERSKVTGAVSSITQDQIERSHATRIEDLIRQRVPGAQIVRRGGGYSIQLRGPTTLTGSNDALIVLDGMPLAENTAGLALAGLAPSDVAQIDVLRDAGASAIYGSRAANGVILIRTRRSR